MVDIINTPARTDSGGTGILVGGILFVIFAMLLVFYGVPALRGATRTSSPESQVQQMPNTDAGDRGMAIPEEINVNVNQPNE